MDRVTVLETGSILTEQGTGYTGERCGGTGDGENVIVVHFDYADAIQVYNNVTMDSAYGYLVVAAGLFDGPDHNLIIGNIVL